MVTLITVGRVIAIGPGGKAQAPARTDLCRPVIELVRDAGLLDRLVLSPPCATRELAGNVRRALYLSARYYCSCGRPFCTRKWPNVPHEKNPEGGCPKGGQRISCQADVVLWTDPQSGQQKYRVQFRLMDKRESMRAVVARYGPDPNKWPYFSRQKQLRERKS